jgi:GNAT superfamily N-acetyltransferase
MAMQPLPTGEEPPKGYETLVNLGTIDDSLRVNQVLVSQLARAEKTEIENMRKRALENVQGFLGLSNAPLTMEDETSIIPDREASDKMVIRAYIGKILVGYALVIIGWPEKCQWLIQHMLINPDFRSKGIGSAILENIEHLAAEAEVDTTSIFAIPIQESGAAFWGNHGYTVESSRHLVRVADVDHELIVYHKEL